MSNSVVVDERDYFIPLRHVDLIQRLAQELSLAGQERTDFDRVCHKLVAMFHVEHLAALIQLEEFYAPLDPDAEEIRLFPVDRSSLDHHVERLLDRLASVLFAAHYEELSRDDVESAIEVGGAWNIKLDVDLSVFDRLLVFARGYRKIKWKRRRWQRLFFEESVEFPEFQRLVLAFRLKPSGRLEKTLRTDVVYLKVFKNIPEAELEVLLPGSRVRFSLFDRGKILLPTLSGAALLLYKLITGALLLTVVTVTAIWNWVVVIALTVGYLIRSLLSYLRTRDKYRYGLTHNLYLKNLDNNSGVIYRVFNEAEEQELCETLLGYGMLWNRSPDACLNEAQLATKSEEFLRLTVGMGVRFDLHDALGKLARLGLASVDSNGDWRATPLDCAPNALEKNWERLFDDSARFWKNRSPDSNAEPSEKQP